MGSAQPATTHQVTEQKLPGWVNRASRSNYQRAQRLAKKPYKAYPGQDVADPSNMTEEGYKYLMEHVDETAPLYGNAAALQGRITELDPIYERAQGLLSKSAGPWDTETYLNPYTEEVEKRAVANAERGLTGRLQSTADAARKAGAFGGSAAAVQQGVLAAEGEREIGDLSAELRRAGYDKATSDLLADRSGMRDAAGGMISGANTQGQGWMDAASGFLSTAQGRQASTMADVTGMLSAGKSEQAQRQAIIDANKGRFEEKRGYGMEKLNMLLASLGMSPYGKTEVTDKTATSEQQGPDWATAGLGLLQMLLPMFSDRRDKTDIEKLGTDPDTGLPMYAYRYKKDPKNTPKVVGPMAQDIEKKWPKAVKEIGGHKVVDVKGMLAA
jgi:hypothetical protein